MLLLGSRTGICMATQRRSYESGHRPKCLVIVDDSAEGDPIEQILAAIDEDIDIAMLVLAANPGAEGPGPLVALIAKTVGSFPVPVMIVPGDLADADIDALS
jgi:hypothetical protein